MEDKMKNYYVEAKTSEDSYANVLAFYKENGKVWISYNGCEERGFTMEEVNEIIDKLKQCTED